LDKGFNVVNVITLTDVVIHITQINHFCFVSINLEITQLSQMILDNWRELLIHFLIHLEAVIVGIIDGRRLIIGIQAVLDCGDDGMDEICRVYL
jgi:hypothetical protein